MHALRVSLPSRLSEISSTVEQFFALAHERYLIKLRRELALPRSEWTADPVLQRYRFCNVFREDDKTTRWFRQWVRDPLRNDARRVLLSTIIFRWFNLISTGEKLLPMLQAGTFNPTLMRHELAATSPLVTGAYMIKTPTGMNKLEGIIWCVNRLIDDGIVERIADELETEGFDPSLQWMHAVLCEAPYMGPFMSYEVVTDLRHTCLGRHATDVESWASPGPGCARGLGWLLFRNPERFDRNSEKDLALMGHYMLDLLGDSRNPAFWPPDWPRWEMREVEHWLCEYDKWCRATYNGQRLKRRFEP